MVIAQWILAVLVAAAFFAAGIMKLVRSRDALIAGGMGWAGDFSAPMVKLIGTLEVIGAAGIIIPLATGIAPVLSPLAAIGLALVMVGAATVHRRRKEAPTVPIVLALLAVASAIVGFIAQ